MKNKEKQRLIFRWSLFLHEETYTWDTTYFDMG